MLLLYWENLLIIFLTALFHVLSSQFDPCPLSSLLLLWKYIIVFLTDTFPNFFFTCRILRKQSFKSVLPLQTLHRCFTDLVYTSVEPVPFFSYLHLQTHPCEEQRPRQSSPTELPPLVLQPTSPHFIEGMRAWAMQFLFNKLLS